MLRACVRRFDVTHTVQTFLETKQGLTCMSLPVDLTPAMQNVSMSLILGKCKNPSHLAAGANERYGEPLELG